MDKEVKINIETFKTVTKAIAESDNLDIMTNHLAQLLVTAMDIKASAIYLLDLETKQLELLASFGLTPKYLRKGPLHAEKSLAATVKGQPVIVSDIRKSHMIQYPEEAKEEGIASIICIPIKFSGGILGALRLYHNAVWQISDQDLDSLHLLGENIGLAMAYTSLLNAVSSIKEIIENELPLNVLQL